MQVMIDALLSAWNRNSDYARKLVADIPDDRMTHQPFAGANHPAWLLAHLSVYHPVLVALARGASFDDPKSARFGMQSRPEPDLALYGPDKAAIVAGFERGRADVVEALQQMDPSRLEAATPLERWRPIMPKVGIVLSYLMHVHESTHLGQLSAWRRACGMPAV